MAENSVSVERVRFDEYETGVKDALEEYQRSVAQGFQEHVSRLNAEYEFSLEAYVAGELEKYPPILERLIRNRH